MSHPANPVRSSALQAFLDRQYTAIHGPLPEPETPEEEEASQAYHEEEQQHHR